MRYISTSIFELFKIGPGPSSSHTIGPMKAGLDFMGRALTLPEADRLKITELEIKLFGSLSATGKGHGTHKAVMAGLLGYKPESCPPEVLDKLGLTLSDTHLLDFGGKILDFATNDIIFDKVQHDFPHSNTLICRLLAGEECLLEMEYYSVGGGFLRWKGWVEPKRGEPVYPYSDMDELKAHLTGNNIRLHELVMANEMAITGATETEIYDGLDQIMRAMENAVEAGICMDGTLPGPIGLTRKAPQLYERAKKDEFRGQGFLKGLNAFALGASEENAAGHRIVTAPTAGAAGVIPAVLFMLKRHMGVLDRELRQGLMAAAAIGFLVKHNASISGAEVGCQGEVGTASAMAAAFLAYTNGYRFQVTENAAEIALEHHLGLTCDPVEGYVQIPCIERNAMGAVKAYNAYLIATSMDQDKHVIHLDKVIEAMANTGRDMNSKYKETALGGLATAVKC